MTEAEERVVLLDEAGAAIGTALKSDVHGPDTPLHLAFSCYVSNPAGELLVTRRAIAKRTFPGVWTNSFCGHPAPGEQLPEGVARRAWDELGITLLDLRLVAPDFRYRAADASGIVEHELCPVFTATTLDPVSPDPDEVADLRWVRREDLATAVDAAPWAFSPWLALQLPLLPAGPARA